MLIYKIECGPFEIGRHDAICGLPIDEDLRFNAKYIEGRALGDKQLEELTYSVQYLGCVKCKKDHHITAFCSCGRCFFSQKYMNDEVGTFVYCQCGAVSLWD